LSLARQNSQGRRSINEMKEALSKSALRQYGIRIPALLSMPISSIVLFGVAPSGWKEGFGALALVYILPLFVATALLATALLNQYIVFLKFQKKSACCLTGLIAVAPATAVAVMILKLLFRD
jgi:hypothetical protein